MNPFPKNYHNSRVKGSFNFLSPLYQRRSLTTIGKTLWQICMIVPFHPLDYLGTGLGAVFWAALFAALSGPFWKERLLRCEHGIILITQRCTIFFCEIFVWTCRFKSIHSPWVHVKSLIFRRVQWGIVLAGHANSGGSIHLLIVEQLAAPFSFSFLPTKLLWNWLGRVGIGSKPVAFGKEDGFALWSALEMRIISPVWVVALICSLILYKKSPYVKKFFLSVLFIGNSRY